MAETRIKIVSVDSGATDLQSQLPVVAVLLGLRPGDDRDDYVVAVAAEPIHFHTTPVELAAAGVDSVQLDSELVTENPDGSLDLLIYGLVMAAHIKGETMHPEMDNFPVALAYIIDSTQMADRRINFAKLYFAAIVAVSMDN